MESSSEATKGSATTAMRISVFFALPFTPLCSPAVGRPAFRVLSWRARLLFGFAKRSPSDSPAAALRTAAPARTEEIQLRSPEANWLLP
jgi:hypothetical protein